METRVDKINLISLIKIFFSFVPTAAVTHQRIDAVVIRDGLLNVARTVQMDTAATKATLVVAEIVFSGCLAIVLHCWTF